MFSHIGVSPFKCVLSDHCVFPYLSRARIVVFLRVFYLVVPPLHVPNFLTTFSLFLTNDVAARAHHGWLFCAYLCTCLFLGISLRACAYFSIMRCIEHLFPLCSATCPALSHERFYRVFQQLKFVERTLNNKSVKYYLSSSSGSTMSTLVGSMSATIVTVTRYTCITLA